MDCIPELLDGLLQQSHLIADRVWFWRDDRELTIYFSLR
jgi:hypothetical protein